MPQLESATFSTAYNTKKKWRYQYRTSTFSVSSNIIYSYTIIKCTETSLTVLLIFPCLSVGLAGNCTVSRSSWSVYTSRNIESVRYRPTYVTVNVWNQPFHVMTGYCSHFMKWLFHSVSSRLHVITKILSHYEKWLKKLEFSLGLHKLTAWTLQRRGPAISCND